MVAGRAHTRRAPALTRQGYDAIESGFLGVFGRLCVGVRAPFDAGALTGRVVALFLIFPRFMPNRVGNHQPSTYAKMSGATMLASLSTMYRGVSGPSLPQVIFSLGSAPEYDP